MLALGSGPKALHHNNWDTCTGAANLQIRDLSRSKQRGASTSVRSTFTSVFFSRPCGYGVGPSSNAREPRKGDQPVSLRALSQELAGRFFKPAAPQRVHLSCRLLSCRAQPLGCREGLGRFCCPGACRPCQAALQAASSWMRDMGMILMPNDVSGFCSSLSPGPAPAAQCHRPTSSLLASLFNEGQTANACVGSQRFLRPFLRQPRCSCLVASGMRSCCISVVMSATHQSLYPVFPVSEETGAMDMVHAACSRLFKLIARLVNITWSAVVKDQRVRD